MMIDMVAGRCQHQGTEGIPLGDMLLGVSRADPEANIPKFDWDACLVPTSCKTTHSSAHISCLRPSHDMSVVAFVIKVLVPHVS